MSGFICMAEELQELFTVACFMFIVNADKQAPVELLPYELTDVKSLALTDWLVTGAFAGVNNLVSAVTGRCDAGKSSDPDMTPLLEDHKVQVMLDDNTACTTGSYRCIIMV